MPPKPLRILLLLLLTLPGCKKTPQAAAPAAPHGIQSTPLQIELATIPAGFTAATGAVDPIRLTSADGGEITVARGTDPIAAVQAEPARLAGLPHGRSLGSIEMLCQFGRVFLTRGVYQEGGVDIEEIRIFLLRAPGLPLVLTYRYPAAGSRRERLDQALAVLQSLQPLS